jgi:protein TonB
VALHALVVAVLLAYAPARSALSAAVPIMVDWIAAPKIEPQVEPARPKPLRPKVAEKRPPPRSIEGPVSAAPADTPPPAVAPSPPPPAAPVIAEAPVAITAPVYDAAYLQNPAPAYPALSRRLREQGRVVLRVLVNPGGSAEDVQLRTSSGSPRLDDTALDTVRRWKFVPARRGVEPVPAWVLIPISFKLEG